MKFAVLSLLFIATAALSAILGQMGFLPLVGFAKHQLAERENQIKIEKMGSPIKNETDRRVVISASNRLREMFNVGACEPIYREADDSFRLGPRPQWTTQCEQLRRQLGEWRSFEVRKTINCSSGSMICIEGLASFANGSYPFEIVWNLVDAKPALFALYFGDPKARILRWEPILFERKLVAPLCDSAFCVS
jgi:hypothetical protein